MRLIDRLSVEAEEFHARADEDTARLLGAATGPEYRRFLCVMYGFVAPLERAIASVRTLDRVIDPRRFRKAEMLRIDLLASRFVPSSIEALPQCTIPRLSSAEEALGWAYPIERSTLGHSNLFRHLAAKLPGDVAFASSYLKCYFGIVGESWKSFGGALEAVGQSEIMAQRVLECARASLRTWTSWRMAQDEQFVAIPDGGIREQKPA
jgi:heme oxygenase